MSTVRLSLEHASGENVCVMFLIEILKLQQVMFKLFGSSWGKDNSCFIALFYANLWLVQTDMSLSLQDEKMEQTLYFSYSYIFPLLSFMCIVSLEQDEMDISNGWWKLAQDQQCGLLILSYTWSSPDIKLASGRSPSVWHEKWPHMLIVLAKT